MGDPLRVQVSGPLAPLADDFATWLAGVGYTPGSAAQQLRRMHTLRHTAAMRLLAAGVDTTVIALWLGHETVATTQI